MPDSKITALASIGTGTDPVNDALVIVDVSDVSPGGMSATGTTKRVSLNNLLASSPTATLASATITGDLTVDTSTLKVDSANDRVGIGIATPAWPLDIRSATAVAQILSTTGTNAAYLQVSNTGGIFYLGRENSAGTSFASPAYSAVLYAGGAYPLVTTVNGSERYRIASDGVATWSNVGGSSGTAMTLNATGLGVGGSPAFRLDVQGNVAGAVYGSIANNNTGGSGSARFRVFNSGDVSDGFAIINNYGAAGQINLLNYKASSLALWTNSVERLTIDSSGNVGIGLAPSAKLDVRGPNNGNQAIFTGTASRGLVISTRSDSLADDRTVIFNAAYAAGSLGQLAFQTAGTDRVLMKNNGQLRFVPLAADPAGAEAGDVYYNSTSNKLKCYNGTTWNDLF